MIPGQGLSCEARGFQSNLWVSCRKVLVPCSMQLYLEALTRPRMSVSLGRTWPISVNIGTPSLTAKRLTPSYRSWHVKRWRISWEVFWCLKVLLVYFMFPASCIRPLSLGQQESFVSTYIYKYMHHCFRVNFTCWYGDKPSPLRLFPASFQPTKFHPRKAASQLPRLSAVSWCRNLQVLLESRPAGGGLWRSQFNLKLFQPKSDLCWLL